MKFLISSLTVLFLLSPLYSQSLPEILIPNSSAAVLDDARSLRINPAGLAVKRSPELFILNYSQSGGYERNGGFFTRLLGLGFGAEFVDQASCTYNRYFLGAGFDAGYGVDLGFSYDWYGNADIGGGWNFGLLFRPNSYLSLGASALNVNSPRIGEPLDNNECSGSLNRALTITDGKINPRYNFGIALRPLWEKLTYSVDVALIKDTAHQYGDSLDWNLRADIEPLDGLNCSLEYHPQANFIGGGIKISLLHFAFQTFSNINEDGKGIGTTHTLHFTFDKMRTFTIPNDRTYIFARLEGEIVEEEPPAGPFTPSPPSLYRIVKALSHMREDEKVRGLVLELGYLDCGLATIQELRAALLDFRLEGKDLIIYAHSLGNKEYYLASAADAIAMAPAGFLGLTGLSVRAVFLKGTMDKIGVSAEMESIGEYKSAASYITREGMSAAQREAESEMLESLYLDFSTNISFDRGISYDTLLTIIDEGPFTAKAAYEKGLVDTLLYPDELEDWVESFLEGKAKLVRGSQYWLFDEYKYSWGEPFLKRIAVIFATGTIISGNSSNGLLSGKLMGAETIARAIREARENPRVKAIVMRIDSPGGEGIASDKIWREVKLTVTGENRKPFIVSMGDVAASGGYYIACAADTIVANSGTITGSIGVVSGKFDLSELHEKIGVSTETIKTGKRSDFYSSFRPWTEEEREHQRKLVGEFYHDFVQRVSEGRDLPSEQVEEVARGRVWCGEQAWERGLVDEIGTLNDALQIAMAMAGVQPGESASFEFYPQYHWVSLNYLFDSLVENRLQPETLDLIRKVNRTSMLYDGEVLYLMPYEAEIE